MPKVAIYPGSFDPPTLGHLDVIERAARLCDHLVVAIGINSAKRPFLTVDKRLQALRECTAHLSHVEVDSFEGLLVDYAHRRGADAVVRGLRATADFEYEFQMAMVNRRLDPDIESIFLMTKWEYSFVTSSNVREIASLGGNYTEFVPPPVVPLVRAAVGK